MRQSAVRRIAEALKTLDTDTTALWFAANTIDLDGSRSFLGPGTNLVSKDRSIFRIRPRPCQARLLVRAIPDYEAIGTELDRHPRQRRRAMRAIFSPTRAVRFRAERLHTARHLGITLGDDLVRRAQPLYPSTMRTFAMLRRGPPRR